ncbi:MAG: anti-sigma factor family protein, partial [Chloroflexota bacterium]
MNSHDRFLQLLALPHGHSDEDQQALDAHLASCASCRTTQHAYTRQSDLIRSMPAATPLPGLRDSVHRRMNAQRPHS